jgi:two-component system response regulator AtoC
VINHAMETASLLVVSSDSAVLRPLWSMKEPNCWRLEIVAHAWEAVDKVQSGMSLDLLVLDLPQGDAEGLHILHWLRRLRPSLPIILIGHSDDGDRKQESMRMGARDYLVRPLDDVELEAVIQRNLSVTHEATEADITSDDIEPVSNGSFFIGVSPIMRKLRAQAALLAETDAPVLIIGEDGSGKETTARLVHRLSVRSGFEFAKVNCAALPGDLLEKELFGYEKISTTAPTRTKRGKLELCTKGTILLDEITEMPPDLQSRLLQVLENKRFVRPGTSTYVEVDVRVLAASPFNVDRAISENRLREDLYHQLRTYTIHVPPLRERKDELPCLSRHFMHRLAKNYGLSPRELSPAIIEAWQAYHWPGNLRELEHSVKRYLMVGDKELAFQDGHSDPKRGANGVTVTKSQSMNHVAPLPSDSLDSLDGVPGFRSLRSLLQSVKSETEKNAIAATLEKTGWNRKAAARALKVSYRSLLYKIEQYHMVSSDSTLLPPGKGPKNTAAGLNNNGQTEWAQVGK